MDAQVHVTGCVCVIYVYVRHISETRLQKTRTTCFIHVMSLHVLMMLRVRFHLRDDLWMVGKAPTLRSLSLYKIL